MDLLLRRNNTLVKFGEFLFLLYDVALSLSVFSLSAMSAKVLVLFYSMYGHNYAMAKAAVEGASEGGANATLKRVKETLPDEVLSKMGALEAGKQWADVPIADPTELADYDGIILVFPTRFGTFPAQMKAFLDATGGLWAGGKLTDKVGSAIVSTATQHGGQETTIQGAHYYFLHHGMVVAGLPYAFGPMSAMDEAQGLSPYGATSLAGPKGDRAVSKNEQDGARYQAKRTAQIAAKMRGSK